MASREGGALWFRLVYWIFCSSDRRIYQPHSWGSVSTTNNDFNDAFKKPLWSHITELRTTWPHSSAVQTKQIPGVPFTSLFLLSHPMGTRVLRIDLKNAAFNNPQVKLNYEKEMRRQSGCIVLAEYGGETCQLLRVQTHHRIDSRVCLSISRSELQIFTYFSAANWLSPLRWPVLVGLFINQRAIFWFNGEM